jgi:hypothetical protein
MRLAAAFALLLAVSVTADAQVPGYVTAIVRSARQYPSNDGRSYAVIIADIKGVDNDHTGIYIKREESETFVPVKHLYGVGFLSWSPDDRYLLADTGSSPYRVFTIIDSALGREIGGGNSQGAWAWMNSTTIAVTIQDGQRSDNLVDRYGFARYDIKDGRVTRTDLLLPDDLTDYRFARALDGGLAIVKKIEYTNTGGSPWTRYKERATTEIRWRMWPRLQEGPTRPVSAILTESRVRIRKAPGLDGEITGHLNRGDTVEILAAPQLQQHIGGMNDWWYLVRRPDGISGWVFGGFLDIPGFN